jgi:hypothetical protein
MAAAVLFLLFNREAEAGVALVRQWLKDVMMRNVWHCVFRPDGNTATATPQNSTKRDRLFHRRDSMSTSTTVEETVALLEASVKSGNITSTNPQERNKMHVQRSASDQEIVDRTESHFREDDETNSITEDKNSTSCGAVFQLVEQRSTITATSSFVVREGNEPNPYNATPPIRRLSKHTPLCSTAQQCTASVDDQREIYNIHTDESSSSVMSWGTRTDDNSNDGDSADNIKKCRNNIDIILKQARIKKTEEILQQLMGEHVVYDADNCDSRHANIENKPNRSTFHDSISVLTDENSMIMQFLRDEKDYDEQDDDPQMSFSSQPSLDLSHLYMSRGEQRLARTPRSSSSSKGKPTVAIQVGLQVRKRSSGTRPRRGHLPFSTAAAIVVALLLVPDPAIFYLPSSPSSWGRLRAGDPACLRAKTVRSVLRHHDKRNCDDTAPLISHSF